MVTLYRMDCEKIAAQLATTKTCYQTKAHVPLEEFAFYECHLVMRSENCLDTSKACSPSNKFHAR